MARNVNKQYEVIIAGAGVAGLYAALTLPESLRVLMVCKREMTLSNRALAQGGVAAVVDTTHDNYKLHIADTLIAGGYKNNLAALEVLVKEGPDDVRNLLSLGVDFDEDSSGNIQMTLEGGHSRRRILHHKDNTGWEIVNKLIERVKGLANVDVHENAQLCTLQRAADGFWGWLYEGGGMTPVFAPFVILATGGIGRVYQYTTNSAIATGDGITFASEMGARIRNLSLVQFHPTVFATAPGGERFLISEAVRGEGAVLLNCDGERFMHRYDEREELAPRDVVSGAIMQEARRTGSDKFYLNISFKDTAYLKNRFPTIYARCLKEGVDITRERIPIFPCQHYLMGGIDVDLKSKTTIDGLYACGECSHTGVHGLNRLASNSLLEALVFSRRAAADIARQARPGYQPASEPPAIRTQGIPIPSGLRSEIRDIMQSSHFVVPNPAAAREGLGRVERIRSMLASGSFAVTPEYVEVKSLATVASIILHEAGQRGNGRA